MINFKLSGIAAGAAFVFSLFIGLISGSGFSVILFRAFVFAAVFFALSALGFWLVSRFLPELLSEGGEGPPAPGSQVDISEESFLIGAFPPDASEAVDDIAGVPSTPSSSREEVLSPLDQEKKTGYNVERDFTDDIGSLVAAESTGNVRTEELPDMGDFSEDSMDGEEDDELEQFESPVQQRSSSRKPALEGDFNPKELAKAIQTVLKKDEKG